MAPVCVLAGVVLGTAAYELIEKPLRRLLSSSRSKQATLARRAS